MAYVEYNSNNSGGSWWLSDEDWAALERAGWIIVWRWFDPDYKDRTEAGFPRLVLNGEPVGTDWLGAKATYAFRVGLSLDDAIAEWERVVGQDAYEEGCPCCGRPHSFSSYGDDGKWL